MACWPLFSDLSPPRCKMATIHTPGRDKRVGQRNIVTLPLFIWRAETFPEVLPCSACPLISQWPNVMHDAWPPSVARETINWVFSFLAATEEEGKGEECYEYLLDSESSFRHTLQGLNYSVWGRKRKRLVREVWEIEEETGVLGLARKVLPGETEKKTERQKWGKIHTSLKF